jgi:hypothetical protein
MVFRVGEGAVAPVAAVHAVPPAVTGTEVVGPGAAEQAVRAGAAGQAIPARAANEDVVGRPAVEAAQPASSAIRFTASSIDSVPRSPSPWRRSATARSSASRSPTTSM